MMSVGLTQSITVAALLLCAVPSNVSAQTRIESLNNSDPVYVQQQQMVRQVQESQDASNSGVPLILFSYSPDGEDDLFDLSARLTLPYGTIASLNRLPQPRLPQDGRSVLIPNQPGLFAPVEASTALERQVLERISRNERAFEVVIPGSNENERYLFGPGLDFSEEERDLFMRGRFNHPIGGGEISSTYGYRYQPFSGVRHFHAGIDFAADFGTPVYAAADGFVHKIDREPVLGLSVTVAHRGEYETVYAHLQEATVAVGDQLNGGELLGYVGSTGMSTGSHLHFEVKYRGTPRDPEQYILWE
jgi:murein DD-endopeptidase MepM/ murein hydrolase activator NlpD